MKFTWRDLELIMMNVWYITREDRSKEHIDSNSLKSDMVFKIVVMCFVMAALAAEGKYFNSMKTFFGKHI